MLVGLTGSFGSGKSTVLGMFERLGAYTVNSDSVVHEILKDREIKKSIADCFGHDVFTDDEVDRKKLAGIVFSDRLSRKKLELLIHPYVFYTIGKMIRKHEGEMVVVEIPLLIETGYDSEVEAVVVVKADSDVVRERLMRKGFTEDDIKKRLSAQMPQDEKLLKADYVIDNSGPLEDTERQVDDIWNELLRRQARMNK